MLRKQNSAIAGVRSRLSYANVAASLALLLALGGTATAAITLPDDSVGSAQIQTDAVRSSEIVANAVAGPEIEANAVSGDEIAANAVGGPEIATDAVGHPEIEEGAVRSSEILDDTIRLADIAPDARAALDAPRVRVEREYPSAVRACDDLGDCPNLVAIHLPAGRWLVQAAFTIAGEFGINTSCSLVQSDTLAIDYRTYIGLGTVGLAGAQVPLMAELTTTSDSTTVGVRCLYGGAQDLFVSNIVLSGVEVKPA